MSTWLACCARRVKPRQLVDCPIAPSVPAGICATPGSSGSGPISSRSARFGRQFALWMPVDAATAGTATIAVPSSETGGWSSWAWSISHAQRLQNRNARVMGPADRHWQRPPLDG